jgi:PadR family transcriptional regulator AphA
MPKTKTALTASEYAVLGLLRREPTYGYELQRKLGGAAGIARVCRVEPAMVYAILKSLATRGLIEGRWDRREYPPKAVYDLTPAGDEEFREWLRQPVSRMREMRLDFLLKLYFGLLEGASLARELTEAQLSACVDYAREIFAELEETEAGTFDEIVLQSKASAVRATQEWLELCLARLS